MAQTGYVDIPAGTDEAFLKVLKMGDRFQFGKIVRNDTLLSVRRKTGISARSKFAELSALWAGLSEAEKTAWATAGGYSNQKGWNLFVQDTCARMKNDLPGVATPAIEHQAFVGQIKLSGGASEIKLIQTHPHTYWVSKKVTGKKGMYEPKVVIENFGLPLQIGLSYKGELEETGTGSFAIFYADVLRSYQGKEETSRLAISLDYSDVWKIDTATLVTGRGILLGYNLFFHLYNVQGSLYFDNIKAIHNATNWARDKNCVNIETTFTKAFSQIPKHWAPVTLPDGAEYDSVYI